MQQYTSIENFLEQDGEAVIKYTLSHPLYLEAVRRMGYTMIGINVLDERGKLKFSIASHNDSQTGEIKSLEAHFEQGSPDVTVKVKESVLLYMLNNPDKIKDNLALSIAKYSKSFMPASWMKDAPQYALLVPMVLGMAKDYVVVRVANF